MAKEDTNKLAKDKGAHPFRETSKDPDSNAGHMNPSGPTTGTEGWGLGEGEAETTDKRQGSLGKKRQNP